MELLRELKSNESDWVLSNIVEKPNTNEAPSDMGVVGRYILKPSIFDILSNTGRAAGEEIQLTDAIAAQLKKKKFMRMNLTAKDLIVEVS